LFYCKVLNFTFAAGHTLQRRIVHHGKAAVFEQMHVEFRAETACCCAAKGLAAVFGCLRFGMKPSVGKQLPCHFSASGVSGASHNQQQPHCAKNHKHEQNDAKYEQKVYLLY